MSSRAARASQTAARVGIPVCSCSSSGEAPVPPSMPSTTMTSAPALAASRTSSKTREAPILTKIGTCAVGRLAELLDLDDQVVGAEEIGMPAGRALIDARREVAEPAISSETFEPKQQTAGARLRSLADGQLDGVGLAQVLDVDAVSAGQDFVNMSTRLGPLDVEHAAVAGGRRGPRLPRSARRAVLAFWERAPKLMPVTISGISSSIGLAANESRGRSA